MAGSARFAKRSIENGFEQTPIMAYAAKYASGFYGPFREAAESTPQFGDRRSYQMDPANVRRGAARSGAGHPRRGGHRHGQAGDGLPGYHLPGETEVRLSGGGLQCQRRVLDDQGRGQNGWIDEARIMMEVLFAIRRAGADMILTYFAKDAARLLQTGNSVQDVKPLRR